MGGEERGGFYCRRDPGGFWRAGRQEERENWVEGEREGGGWREKRDKD